MVTNKKNSTKQLVYVVGMHRSGTSLTTEIINQLGVELLGQQIPTEKTINRNGFWEDKNTVDLNKRILGSLNTFWYGLSAIKKFDVGAVEENFLHEIRQHLQKCCSSDKAWVIKDPRVSLLYTLWVSQSSELAIKCSCIYCIRHPFEVASSINKRDKLPKINGIILWILYVLYSVEVITATETLIVDFDRYFTSSGELLLEIIGWLDANGVLIKPPTSTTSLELTIDHSARRNCSKYLIENNLESPIAEFAENLYAVVVNTKINSAEKKDQLNSYRETWERLWSESKYWIELLDSIGIERVQVNGKLTEIGTELSKMRERMKEYELGMMDVLAQCDELEKKLHYKEVEAGAYHNRILALRKSFLGRLLDWYYRPK